MDTVTQSEPKISAEMREELGNAQSANYITVNFYDNDCHTVFSGKWDGKMVRAAIRSIEKGYVAQRHLITKEAARKRMSQSLSSNGGSEDGR